MVSIMKINKYTKIGNFLNSKLVKNTNQITVFDGETIPRPSIADYIERIIEGISFENEYNWCIPVALIYIKRLRDTGLKLDKIQYSQNNFNKYIISNKILGR